jgi:hypothetical protein
MSLPPRTRTDPHASRARAFGWALAALSASFGLLLESAHAFKWSAYLDAPVARLMFTLAHAHGLGLALVVLVHALQPDPRGRGALMLGAVLMPLGFFAGGVGVFESDPGVGVVLAPIGALSVLLGLGQSVWAALRPPPP